MKNYYSIILALLISSSINTVKSQDTFSIVAVDTITGEVGSAGASCVDMDDFTDYDDDFLGELFPGVGAINTQAWYLATNQANARERMNAGDMPQQIIDWLYNNDAQNNPEKRQYGIVRLNNNSSLSAAFTGNQTDDYKNHITGPNYSIQGNILKGPEVLDSMETRFLREEGDLACKLMAALQGAKMIGADSRCFSNGTSSLFSFVKVAQTDDVFGEPSFLLSVRTSSGEGIEPIDSLQVKFDLVKQCSTVGYTENNYHKFQVFPNPATDKLNITFKDELKSLKILNLQGQICMSGAKRKPQMSP
ncbi:MAG: DUF1028 domain-containing protein [Chlorobi bacterium]|nr:DUF1028 domain-containing protein [Chlorobiota bacterium]